MIFIYPDIPISGFRILFLPYKSSCYSMQDLPGLRTQLSLKLCFSSTYVLWLIFYVYLLAAGGEHRFKCCPLTLTLCFKLLINRVELVIFSLQWISGVLAQPPNFIVLRVAVSPWSCKLKTLYKLVLASPLPVSLLGPEKLKFLAVAP